ncbi:unnamed protein product [Phytophthora fragariaefolia]|uniref:Unnamed protein product n=1 Tax=Phytophthora fragariaefolia TaxID=1490495 RepID=A0A9W7CIY6_9STRA|nr:unnamed protein product [Phytophthora fragariaefolia]
MDIEGIVTTGTDRTVRQVQESTQSHFLALARLVVDLNRQPPLRTDYELDQRLEAAGSLSDVVDALALIPRSPAPWEYELTELRDDVASLEARLAASEASLRREVDLRFKAERLCNQASHERNAALENLRRIRLDHADASRQLVATNIALEQSSQAAAVLEQRCRRLDKSPADTHKVIRQERDSASAPTIPAAFVTFLEELGALQLAIPPPPATSGSPEGSGLAPPASSGSLDGTAAKSGSLTSLTVDSDDSDDTGPIVPSALHKGKGKRPAKSSAKLQSAPPTPKKKQRLGRPLVDLKARKAAQQAAAAVVSSSGPPQSVPSSLPAASLSTSSAQISGIAVSADSDVLSFASIPSGSDPPLSPTPRTPASPASSTASTASLPSTPVVSRGITPGTEASVPVEIDDDGGFGADGAASEASVAPGGVFSSPVVSQPRRDGRLTRAASTTAGIRSMVAAENETAPDALVLSLATPLRMPAATQASVASPASVPDPDKSAAVVAAASAAVVTSSSVRRRVANTHTGPIPPARVVPTPTPRQASTSRARTVVTATLSTMPGTRSTAFEPVTTIPAPIQSKARSLGLRARLPESPCTFGADDFMPDKSISIRASGLAIVVKLWRQFTGRAVGRTEHSDLGFALWERAHWISVAAVEQWLQQLSDRIGSDTHEYLEAEAAWRAYNKARNLRADRFRLQIPKRFWVWCTPDASGKIKCPLEILLEPSMLQYSFETLTWVPSTRLGLPKLWIWMPNSLDEMVGWGSTREEVGAAIVVNPALRQSHVTAPWVQEFSDARAQAAADASAAADSPSDASSARTPIPAADQANVQAELEDTSPAQARLDVLADLATTAEI